MGVKVYNAYGGHATVYQHAHSWYAGDDKTLQIYQHVGENHEFIIAEFAEGNWEHAEIDPLPDPEPQPEPAGIKEGDEEKGEVYDLS